LFKIIGINHIVEFKVALNVLFVYTKLQFYGDNANYTWFFLCVQVPFVFLSMFLVFKLQNSKSCTTFAPQFEGKTLNFLLAR